MSSKHESTAIRRAQIMEAAGRLVIRRGSEHLTVKGIAREVGISEGAIYRHFKSKKDVLLFLVDSVRDRLLAEYISPGTPGDGGMGAIESALKNHTASISRRGGVSFQIIAEIISLGDKELSARSFCALESFVGRLEELLAEAKNQGQLRQDVDARVAAASISYVLQGLVNTWVLSDYRFDLKSEFAAVWQTFIKGLADGGGEVRKSHAH